MLSIIWSATNILVSTFFLFGSLLFNGIPPLSLSCVIGCFIQDVSYNIGWVVVETACIGLVYLLTKFVICVGKVPSESMCPTIHKNDIIIAMYVRYTSALEIDDIIILRPPKLFYDMLPGDSDCHTLLVKRLVAVNVSYSLYFHHFVSSITFAQHRLFSILA